MRHINIDELANLPEVIAFEKMANNYLNQLINMTPTQRKEFIKKHTDWNTLQDVMFKLSNGKCWYSEAPAGAGDYEIDHFRPKNRAKNYDGQLIKRDGYWWLTYNWRNYRLAGGLVNKRRKDRLNKSEEIKGKGDYFPIDTVNGRICADYPNDNINIELPILLDPTKLYDTTLISFDKDGLPLIIAGLPDDDRVRAEISIELYHLELDQLNQQRAEVWRLCERELEEFNEQIINPFNVQVKRLILERACVRIKELTSKKAPFSKVAISCITSYSQKPIYCKWLPNLMIFN